MESNNEEKIRFTKTSTKTISLLSRIKGTLAGKDIIISIAPTRDNNYVSTKCANQLVIPESNIIEMVDSMDEKQHHINNLQLSIGDYTFVSQFTVKSLFHDDSDIILGSPWMEALGSFILNTKKKFLTFSYKKKKITLQDSTLESDPITSEEFKDISKVILQEIKNQCKICKKKLIKLSQTKTKKFLASRIIVRT